MPYHYERPRSLAAPLSRKLGRFSLALALTALLLHRFDVLSLPGAVAVLLLAAALSLLVLGLSSFGFFMLWHKAAKGGRAAFSGLIMAALVLGPFGYAASRYFTLPALHDVSTDTVEPPEWLKPPRTVRSWLPRTDPISAEMRAEQLASYPALTGRRYEGAIDRVLIAVQAVTTARKWKLVANLGAEELALGLEPVPESAEDAGPAAAAGTGEADPARAPIPSVRPDLAEGAGRELPARVLLQYDHRSLILGIHHDIVVRLVEEEETTYVDIRSATRDGEHDLGTNAALARGFLVDLDVMLLGIAGG